MRGLGGTGSADVKVLKILGKPKNEELGCSCPSFRQWPRIETKPRIKTNWRVFTQERNGEVIGIELLG